MNYTNKREPGGKIKLCYEVFGGAGRSTGMPKGEPGKEIELGSIMILLGRDGTQEHQTEQTADGPGGKIKLRSICWDRTEHTNNKQRSSWRN